MDAKEIIAILNSGYKVGATRPVLVPSKGGGWDVDEMSTFAPVVMAGNQPNLPDDTVSRTILVLLLPDWQGRAEESDWETIDNDAQQLRDRIGRWVERVDLGPRPDLPPGCVSRFREKWMPLARIAHAAGGRWPKVVWELATADVAELAQDRAAGLAAEKPAVLLLRHIIEDWPDRQDFWASNDLVVALAVKHPDNWGPTDGYKKGLTVQRLGRLLSKAFRIRSAVEDSTDKNSPRGYRKGQFGTAAAAMNRPGGSGGSERSGGSGAPPEGPPPDELAELYADRLV